MARTKSLPSNGRPKDGWTFLELAEDYAVFQNAGIDGGINPDPDDRTRAPLVVIETDDISSMQTEVRDAGATIKKSLFE